MGMMIVLPMLILLGIIFIWYVSTALFGEAIGKKVVKVNDNFKKNLLTEDEMVNQELVKLYDEAEESKLKFEKEKGEKENE